MDAWILLGIMFVMFNILQKLFFLMNCLLLQPLFPASSTSVSHFIHCPVYFLKTPWESAWTCYLLSGAISGRASFFPVVAAAYSGLIYIYFSFYRLDFYLYYCAGSMSTWHLNYIRPLIHRILPDHFNCVFGWNFNRKREGNLFWGPATLASQSQTTTHQLSFNYETRHDNWWAL